MNQDPESAQAGAGWTGDFGIVIEAEPGKLAKPFTVHVVPKNGRLEKISVLRDPDELEEFEPAYLAKAPYSIWKGLRWSVTIKFVIDGIIYGLVTAATFAWMWPAAGV